MSRWLNHVAIKGSADDANPRVGVNPATGTVATGTQFSPTAGRLLVCVVEGSVTSTTPTGWTLGASAINNTGLYVWWRVAAGGDTITTTHNGTNYAVMFDFYEFAAGSTFAGAVGATGVSYNAGAGPLLSGLGATVQVYGVAGQGVPSAGPYAGSWSNGVELVDVSIVLNIDWGTPGYTYGITELVDYTGPSSSSNWTSTNSGVTVERLQFAVQGPYTAATYAPRSTWYSGISPRPTASLLGSTARVVGADLLLGTLVVSGTSALVLTSWDGSAWKATAKTTWDGSAWKTDAGSFWNGSAWV
jgi:hypothetical protein